MNYKTYSIGDAAKLSGASQKQNQELGSQGTHPSGGPGGFRGPGLSEVLSE